MDIKNLQGEVIFTTVLADLHGADLQGANLRGADLHGANLRGANLHGADLHGADLRWANLRGANLRGANLHGADLYGADLHGADLHGANLHGADLHGAKGVTSLGSPDGWPAWCWLWEGGLSIRVGCKEMRLAEALEYWDRPEKTNRREVVAAVRYAEAIAIARGWALK